MRQLLLLLICGVSIKLVEMLHPKIIIQTIMHINKPIMLIMTPIMIPIMIQIMMMNLLPQILKMKECQMI